MTRVFAAVDVGASGGRVMAGAIEGDRLRLETVHRFPNAALEREGHLRWDPRAIADEVRRGLSRVPGAESIGIDTWGVDYGLLDDHGSLIADPVCHRDGRTATVVDDVHAIVTFEELYRTTGVQFLPFNTVYQLAAEQRDPHWERARWAVLIPDLLAYWLTGEIRSEVTAASTTGLLDVRTLRWSASLLAMLGIPADLLPPLQHPGELRGRTQEGTAVTAVGSHDTASAVAAVPATGEDFAYISSGTWSLVGVELDAPVLSDGSRDNNFSNEIGVDGRTRYLRNVGGLWLLQECLRTWQRDDLGRLLADAAALPPGGPIVDVDDPAFVAPGRMPERISAAACERQMDQARTVRCILDSLAAAYGTNVRRAERLSGKKVEVVHMVGGGSRNELLCTLTADACGVPVVAGPAEATAIGNLVVQARTARAAPPSLEALRALVASSVRLTRYEPDEPERRRSRLSPTGEP